MTTREHIDESMMRSALDAAYQAKRRGDLAVGAVVARNDQILAVGANKATSQSNLLLHAEIVALQALAAKDQQQGLTLYATFEPCPMCLGACLVYGIERIVVGGQRDSSIRPWGRYEPSWLIDQLGSQGPKVEVVAGPFARQCTALRVSSLADL